MAKMDPNMVNAIFVVGALVIARWALCVLGSLFTTFLRPGKNLKKYGAWAIVTGATGKQRATDGMLGVVCLSLTIAMDRTWLVCRLRPLPS